jgi:hypothetical protein
LKELIQDRQLQEKTERLKRGQRAGREEGAGREEERRRRRRRRRKTRITQRLFPHD